MNKIELSHKFLYEISDFDNIYIEVSGGYHSSNTVLLFYEYGFKECILFNNITYLEYSECKANIDLLLKLTSYSLIQTKPNFRKYETMNNLMKESFQNIDKAKQKINSGKLWYRDFFPCCKILKKYPSYSWLKNNILPNSVIISSLTPYESFQRQMRLYELVKQDTYLRFHKTKNNYVAYPYRDLLYGGRKNSRKLFEIIRDFPVEDIIINDDKVVERYTATGTHNGDLYGIPPTYKKAKISGIDIVIIKNGKMIERWGQADLLGLIKQLGIIPELNNLKI